MTWNFDFLRAKRTALVELAEIEIDGANANAATKPAAVSRGAERLW